MSNANDLQWLKIDLSCPESLIDPVTDTLGILSGSGVEEKPAREGRSLISSFFQLTPGNSRQKIILQVKNELQDLFAIYGQTLPELTSSLLADEDWATSWQQFFKPFAIIPGLVIKPGWEQYQPGEGEQVIEMDPGMAFGTGKHASTRLALALMHSCFQQNTIINVLDVGTGTGILAMAAVLFGAEKVTAVDNDPEAVKVCQNNCLKNKLAAYIDCSATDISAIEGSYELISANIIHNVLITMLPDFSRLLPRGGLLVLAGILQDVQEQNIIDQALQYGFIEKKILHDEEWSGILLTRQ